MEKIQGGGQIPLTSEILANSPYIECESCSSQVFEEKMLMKRVSKFMTGDSQDTVVPLPVIACAKCGHVNEMFKPKV